MTIMRSRKSGAHMRCATFVACAPRTSARPAGLAGRMWAPDFRDRMAVIARAPDAPQD